MTSSTNTNVLSKPILATVIILLLAIPLQVIPGFDLFYDIVAVLFLGTKWKTYLEAAKALSQAAPSARPEKPSARQLYDDAHTAFKAGKFDEALRLFTLSADAGDADAMNYIGTMHHNANGRPKNYKLAGQWYAKAITAGERKYAPANIELVGTAYFNGKDVPENKTEAARLWRIAADTGLAAAQADMGLAYRYGQGVPLDRALARHWYGLAAAQGDEFARKKLAELDAEDTGGKEQRQESRASGNGKMTRAQALEVIELKEGASKAQMRSAYVRLMQQVHPDKGGSNYFAKQLNEAREVLGF